MPAIGWLRAHPKRAIAIALPLLVVIAILWASTWYVTGEIASGGLNPSHGPPGIDAEVVAVTGDRITLRGTRGDDWKKAGSWGASWQGGFGLVGELLSIEPETHTSVRAWEPLESLPLAGTRVALTSAPYPTDALTAMGFEYETFFYPSELGPMPAWLIPGTRDTWAVFVHGKSAEQDALVVAQIVHSFDLPLLNLGYRNDRAAPAAPHGRFEYGVSEWRDVEAGVRYALDAGAQDIVLFGTSMGGGIVVSFLYESPLATSVRGVVLDAPMLDLEAVFTAELTDSGVPGFTTGLLLRVTELRYGVDLGAADYLSRNDRLTAPILLFHGSADQTIPVELSDELARLRPDLVRYERYEGVTHARSHQERPAHAEAALRGFLAELLADE